IATGGSAVYSSKAMDHLRDISTIVFLRVDLEELQKRISNFNTRGIAKAEDQSFLDLFNERERLYRKYAHFTIEAASVHQDDVAILIEERIKEFHGQS
ncbi:MAG: hypothetical protein JEY91_12965, partial [Spirochaetaceae bacterium]|nr:hypothetical protein [Spirochaetaceae bacterium]